MDLKNNEAREDCVQGNIERVTELWKIKYSNEY